MVHTAIMPWGDTVSVMPAYSFFAYVIYIIIPRVVTAGNNVFLHSRN